jgi:hypothetical protein
MRPLDGSLEAALRLAVPEGSGVVMLTFGDSGVMPMLRNFISHASGVGAPFVIGAVDALAFEQLASLPDRVAVYKTPLARESSYRLDGSNAHASSSWQRFAQMRTGEVAAIVRLGFDVLHTDVDVAWLQNPAPYISCLSGAGSGGGTATGGGGAVPVSLRCDALRNADVAVSSDNMSPGDDARGGISYAIGGTLNTGILLVRATEAGKHFADTWHRSVLSRACPVTDHLTCRQLCTHGSCYGGTCSGDCNAGRCCTSDQQVLNRLVRDERLPYPGLNVPRGSSRTAQAAGVNVTLGALPLPLFLHGHGYFVQRARREGASAIEGVHALSPYAVHATYTLDNHDGLAKAQRFREAGLWHVDPPAHFQGKFLALNFSVAPQVQAAIDKYVQRREVPSNIDVHLTALRAYVAELRDALALAQALGRTLVLPRWACYCDRLWSGSDDIFHFGCMYPGAQDGKFVPFTCPMDHVLSPKAWHDAGVDYRDANFVDRLLDSVGPSGRDRVSVADVVVGSGDAGGGGGRVTALPIGISETTAVRLLEPHAQTTVVRLSSARGLLCGLTGDAAAFNRLARSVLAPPVWCSTCFQNCADELLRWLDPATISKGATNPKRWCARVEAPIDLPLAAEGCPTAG